MNKYNIIITEPAEIDLKEIGRYISKELLEPVIALKMIEKIGTSILNLEQMPQRNSLVIDERLRNQGVRKVVVDNYIIFYVISEKDKQIFIVRILYGRRDWINLL